MTTEPEFEGVPDEITDEAAWAFIQSRVLPASMWVTLSDQALTEALRLASEDKSHLGKSLRVYIEGKGCDGFYYGVSFDARTPADLVFPASGLDVIVDPESLRFLHGAKVTWVDDERGRGFLVENPNHKRFRGKFYKRRAWQTHLDATSSSSR